MDDKEWGIWFESHGPASGKKMIDPELTDLDGISTRLSDLWKNGPAIITTASLTCPIVRRRIPEIQELLLSAGDSDASRFNQISRGVIYCKEAHPVGSPAPHGEGREWITPANMTSGILHRQPQTMQERLALARIFKQNLMPQWIVLVDDMNNTTYDQLGTASCMGFVVDRNGIVRGKYGWIDPRPMVGLALQLLDL